MKNEFTYTGTDNLEVMQEARNYNAFLVSLALRNVTTANSILDVGAGIGLFADIVRQKGGNVVCFEPDVMQAEIIDNKGITAYTSLDPIENESFDFIYSFNVLEHIENDTEALESWASKLKPGGKMLIYVPAFNVLFSSMDKKVGHFRRYTRKTLTQKVTDAGLKIVKTAQYADSIGFLVTLVYKKFHKRNGDINKNSLIFYDRFLFPLSKLCDRVFSKMLGKNVYVTVKK